MKVFISYSSKDGDWVKNWLIPKLERAGIQVHIDFRDFKIGVPSIVNMEEAVKNCDKTLLLLTPQWLASDWTDFEAVMLQTSDPVGKKGTIVPLMLEKCDLPPRLSIFTYADFKDKAIWQKSLNRLFTQWGVSISAIEEIGTGTKQEPPGVSLSRLPETMTPELVGREKEMTALDEAWDSPHTRIVTLIAWGGIGKTCLTTHWLKKMAKARYKGAKHVYAWSFYSQGASESKQASADSFIVKTLEWFGDSQAEEGDMTERARRLARLIQQENTMLILDGMEPLQYPENGRLKDYALNTMLKELVHGTGEKKVLCLISSRLRLSGLDDFTGKDDDPVKVIDLDYLDIPSGVKLLRLLGASKGLKKDFEAAVKELNGHALSLTLLGRLVKNAHQGDIRKRDKIKRVFKEKHQGEHAFHVMHSYEHFMKGKPELDILRLMGLFDRPAIKEAIKVLITPPAIYGVTEALQGMEEEDIELAISSLREQELLNTFNSPPVIHGSTEDFQSLSEKDREWVISVMREGGLYAPERQIEDGEALDCHPLVREYFAHRVEQANHNGWHRAHERLYNFYRELPGKEQPNTLAVMEPLFCAVVHGCKAGLHQRVINEVYESRIRRYGKDYPIHNLGIISTDLALLSNFFKYPWSIPAEGLRESYKPAVLGWAAFRLRALGRLKEALRPMRADLTMVEKTEEWEKAAGAAGNLSELMLTLGHITQATKYGRKAVEYAERSWAWFERFYQRTNLAEALHQAGRRDEAMTIFREAEEIQNRVQPEFPFLYSVQGYRYRELLLELEIPLKSTEIDLVIERARVALKTSLKEGWILSIGLDHLTIGQALLMSAQMNPKQRNWVRIQQLIDQSVEELQKSGFKDYLPKGLLVRAKYFRLRGEFDNAHKDLIEALEIAEAGEMGLHLADYHLESAWLAMAEGKKDKCVEHLEIAEKMIKEMGYLRRVREVEEIKKN